MSVTTNIVPVTTPRKGSGQYAFYRASLVGDGSGGNATFYLLGLPIAAQEQYIIIDSWAFSSQGNNGGAYFSYLLTTSGNAFLDNPGLVGASILTPLDMGINNLASTGGWFAHNQFHRPIYLGHLKADPGSSWAKFDITPNINAETYVCWIRAIILDSSL